MVTRCCIIIQPDIVVLLTSDSDYGAGQCQFEALKATRAMLEPAPRGSFTKNERNGYTGLAFRRHDPACRRVCTCDTFLMTRNAHRGIGITRLRKKTIGDCRTERHQPAP